MSARDELLRGIERVAELAVAHAEQLEHKPILITPTAVIPIAGSGELAPAVHAICEKMRPAWAVSVHEAWGIRPDAPDWAIQAALDTGRVANQPRDHRDELLMLYAEDDLGNWCMRVYVIEARAEGRVVLREQLDGTYAGMEDGLHFSGAMTHFVPRRVNAS